MTTSSEVLHVDDNADGVRVLALHRPQARNALSIQLRDDVSAAIEASRDEPSLRAIVLTGSGSTFSAGFDLHEFDQAADDPEFHRQLWASSDRFHHSILGCAVPVVAALNGPAIAGGFDLATLCDLRVAQPGVWFQRPEVEFGVPLFGPLRELVGGGIARELCFTNRRIDHVEALRIGLVNEVTQADGAFDRAIEVAGQIAARPVELVRQTKAKVVSTTALAAPATLAL